MLKDEPIRNATGVPKRRRFLPRIVLATVSVLITLAGLEITLRGLKVRPQTATTLDAFFAYDSGTGWRGIPRAAARFATVDFDTTVRLDSDGFRPSGDRPAGSKVAWCVGDSMTWGFGVEEDASFVARLNQHAGKTGWWFRNLGICGYSTVQEYHLLREMLSSETPPDAVILFFVPNDLEENVDGKDMDPPRPYVAVEGGDCVVRNHPVPAESASKLHPWLNRHVLLYNHANFYFVNARTAFRNWRATGAPAIPAPYEDRHWTAFEHVLDWIHQLCGRREIPLLLVYLPGLAETGEPRLAGTLAFEDARKRRFLDVADQKGIPALELATAFREYRIRQGADVPISFPTDPHWNPEGNAVAAQAIGEWFPRQMESKPLPVRVASPNEKAERSK